MENYSTLFLWLGRILLGGFFLLSGINHLREYQAMSKYAASKNVPFPQWAVIFSGLLILLGGLGVILGIYPRLSLVLILIFLIPVSFIMHPFWKEKSPQKDQDMINFMKNMALVGACLMLLSVSFPWNWSLF